jgi:hypothetical protein
MRIDIEDLNFLTPPRNQGQMIEVSYAGDYQGNVVKRVHDLSDRSTRYYIAPFDFEAGEEGPIGLNGSPAVEGEWKPLKV